MARRPCPVRYAVEVSTQIAVRLTEGQLAGLDWIVRHCSLDSRADAVRTALVALERRLRREQIDQEIIDGYARVPETAAEMAEARRLTIESIAEEPWEKWW